MSVLSKSKCRFYKFCNAEMDLHSSLMKTMSVYNANLKARCKVLIYFKKDKEEAIERRRVWGKSVLLKVSWRCSIDWRDEMKSGMSMVEDSFKKISSAVTRVNAFKWLKFECLKRDVASNCRRLSLIKRELRFLLHEMT